jgi:hypothetical protein
MEAHQIQDENVWITEKQVTKLEDCQNLMDANLNHFFGRPEDNAISRI